MRIYLDVSCLDRPYDDQQQERIWKHVSSETVLIELGAMPDRQRQRQVRALLPPPSDIIPLSSTIFERAEALVSLGFKPADAVHVAAAEHQHADVLLTCDDRLLRRAKRFRHDLGVAVHNPLSWMHEHDQPPNA